MRPALAIKSGGARAAGARAPAPALPAPPHLRPTAGAAAAAAVRSVLVRSSSSTGAGAAGANSESGSHPRSRSPSPLARPYPTWEEEHDVSHDAFMRAFTASHPVAASVPGLQEFAAALLDRRRSIPSAAHPDPLDNVFTEADVDSDGLLSAVEVSEALRSRGVDASPEIVGRYIRCARDAAGAPHPGGELADETIGRREFAAFVLAMASADLHHHGPAAGK